jgi:hypothetical protein
MDNNTPPYKHWMTTCAACGKVTPVKSCRVPGPIDPLPHSTEVQCMHCKDQRDYLSRNCFLAPMSLLGGGNGERSTGALAVVAGLIAAVKLARVESTEIRGKSPHVRSIISDSVTIARMVLEMARTERH